MRAKSAALAGALLLAGGLAVPAQAGPWTQAHPRQAQVLARTHHQAVRINHQRREGDLTGAEARALRSSNRAIVQQTRAYAKDNGGYITRAEQRTLNQQLNAQSRAIGR
ncbi:hypothetical protein H7F53_16410 [Novosphingobium piscinae]|uniref:DUF4148 domain-containing protein n=1 Tax=Novosphingobium piscinae TaxID=1507448 RepID=A0A7X1KRG0_9SPHN|nr:hypothetical protein [Novosphingobium piscinae]